MPFEGRRALWTGSLLLLAFSIAGAEDATKREPLTLNSASEGPPSLEPRARSVAKRAPRPIADPFAALDAPLAPDERTDLRALAERLSAPALETREAAAKTIQNRFGARAAGPLLEIAGRDLDCERRFRERALVSSLVFEHFLEHAPHCGWLGIRWLGASTEKHYFSAHVVEAVSGEPAQKAGMLANDEIVAWNGQTLENQLDFIDHVQAQPPGSVAELTVERGNRDVIVRVVMGTRVDQVTHLPELPYPTFQRDMAQREVVRWLAAWKKRH